jgi:mRNA interferase RelE/StbE
MEWEIKIKSKATKSLNRLDRVTQDKIRQFFKRLALQDNPRLQGKALTGKYSGLWRYRVGDYRLICHIEDEKVTILVLELGHRKDIYKI